MRTHVSFQTDADMVSWQEETVLTIAKTQNRSLVETISAGYTVLNRRLWLLLIPIVLDLYFWFGAQLSFAPFFRLIRDAMLVPGVPSTLSTQQQEQLFVQLQNTDMRGAVALLNFVPTVVPGLRGGGSAISDGVMYVGNPLAIVALVVAINLLALLVSSTFLTLMAGGVRSGRSTAQDYVRRSLEALAGIGGYCLMLLGAIVMIGVPLLLIVGALTLMAPALVSLGLLLGVVVGFWIYVYTGFAVEAVLICGPNPVQAVGYSVRVVQRYFLETIGLICLSFIIITGMAVVWDALAGSVWGVILAILGNAYIGSGLVLARLVFFRDRLARMMQPVAV
jgi:hypothetical protein